MKAKSTIGDILYKQAMVDHQRFPHKTSSGLHKNRHQATKNDVLTLQTRLQTTRIMSQQPNINKESKKGEANIWEQIKIPQEEFDESIKTDLFHKGDLVKVVSCRHQELFNEIR
jgi:hypothetical protein